MLLTATVVTDGKSSVVVEHCSFGMTIPSSVTIDIYACTKWLIILCHEIIDNVIDAQVACSTV